jgi:hypothetical protein
LVERIAVAWAGLAINLGDLALRPQRGIACGRRPVFFGRPDTGPIFRALALALVQEITALHRGVFHSPEGRKTYAIEFKLVISIF